MLHVLSTPNLMRIRSVFALLTLALPSIALAVSFPDVPAGHLYKQQIETLADKGIIKGNPDGTFNPDGTVNRAELLTLLYRAEGKTPANPTKACFKDVSADAWFSAVVCDAAFNGYVGGYPDGYFRPGNAVNRVEALKMIHTVLGLTVSATASMDPLKSYRDVSLSAWYTPYMASAFAHKILPVDGQTGDVFMPEAALTRGEAAAYIFNGLGLTVSGTSSSEDTTTSDAPSSDASSSVRTRSAASSVSSVGPVILDVDFPFADDGMFHMKDAKIYKFTLKSPVVGSFKVSVLPDNTVQCRLYKLDAGTSFALEYYVGQMVDNNCWMRTSLAAGDYQLQVIPNTKNDNFTLATKIVTGDGNDGFNQATNMLKGLPKNSSLDVGDYADFYTFTLVSQQHLTVSVSDNDNTSCLIYPMENVDIFGFSGPTCNQAYDFPPGTYVVSVTRRDQVQSKISFSVQYQ